MSSNLRAIGSVSADRAKPFSLILTGRTPIRFITNSSRFVVKILRNINRSNRGVRSSNASFNTRRLNSNQLRSRLRNSTGAALAASLSVARGHPSCRHSTQIREIFPVPDQRLYGRVAPDQAQRVRLTAKIPSYGLFSRPSEPLRFAQK